MHVYTHTLRILTHSSKMRGLLVRYRSYSEFKYSERKILIQLHSLKYIVREETDVTLVSGVIYM